MKTIAFLILTLAVFLAACGDPTENKPKAEISEPSTNAGEKTKEPKAKGTELKITPENSKISFVGSKVTGKHDGGFKEFSGTIDVVNQNPKESSVSVDIDMKSVFSDSDKLTTHLQSGDFFQIDKFPKSSFVSTKIEADTENGENNYKVTGDLTLRGEKKTITFPAKIEVTDEKLEVKSEFAINRKNFGIVYPGKPDDLIRDNVLIKLEFKSEFSK